MLSKLIRRTHMYLALFLAPWMLMYALSTMAMNHRGWFQRGQPVVPVFSTEREFTFDGSFPDSEPRTIARHLLVHLDLDGAHAVSRRPKDGAVVINRQDLLYPRRITYTPADRRVVVEKLPYRGNAFLERMHRRRGYAQEFAVDDAWAFSVDLVIAGMVFWALSGLWMWWEMKLTRRLGAAFILVGLGLFALYLAAL